MSKPEASQWTRARYNEVLHTTQWVGPWVGTARVAGVVLCRYLSPSSWPGSRAPSQGSDRLCSNLLGPTAGATGVSRRIPVTGWAVMGRSGELARAFSACCFFSRFSASRKNVAVIFEYSSASNALRAKKLRHSSTTTEACVSLINSVMTWHCHGSSLVTKSSSGGICRIEALTRIQ